jgi:chaperonin GroEL (HSP60 family)
MVTMETVFSQKYKRTTGKDVWRENLRLAIFAADKIRSTLGPKGAYKIVAYNRGPEQIVKVTKDPIAILDELAIQYPPAVIVAEAAKMQREEAGDGVTTFVVFLSALLKKADELLSMKIHPNTIIHGYYLATEKALELIDNQATHSSPNNDVLDTVDCKRNLLTKQIRLMIMEAYQLALSDGRFCKENVRFLNKQGGKLQESNLIKGIVIKKEKAHPNMPDRLQNLRIAITTERPGINRLDIKMKGDGPTQIKLSVQNADQMRKYKEAEDKIRAESFDKMIKLKVNVLLCEQPIDNTLKGKLLQHGIFALERVDKKDTDAVAKATGAKAVGKLNDLAEEDLGTAEELYTDKLELEKTVTIKGCRGATFMLRGSTPQAINELENAIRASMVVLKIMDEDNRVLPGSGASEAHLAKEINNFAKEFPSREQIAIESFGAALMEVPRCLMENYGLNPTDAIPELKKRHADGFCNYGVNEQSCCEMVCFEPARIKRSVIRRAYEVSSLMLRIDELLIAKEIPKFHKK